MTIRSKAKALEQSRSTVARLTYRLLKKGWHCGKLMFINSYRSKHLTKRQYGSNYFQNELYTTFNRYPLLFAECKAYLSMIEKPKILSFGCATGEEVFTLGSYLPNAAIIGADINAWCLKQCKKKNTEGRFLFYHRFSDKFINSRNFDAIFCLAVFQRSENRTEPGDKAKDFTFEKFEEEILMLDKKLKPGGLFIIDHVDFSFMETSCSDNYKPLEFEKNKLMRNRPLFNRHNIKIADVQETYRVFVKRENK